jgi:biopolymer transport protein ExbB/TolQ
MIDRWMAYSAARKQLRSFAPEVANALRDGRIDEAIKVAERNNKSHLAKVVTAGLMEFKAHQDSAGVAPGQKIEASKRALERTEAIVHAELKRGLGGLATIGSTAPFVGLFGAVMGILNAFIGISNAKDTGLAAVAGGIAVALVMTAIGLLVAIPAVMMFNYLTGRVEAFDVGVDDTSDELVDYFLERQPIRRVAVEMAAGSTARSGSGSSVIDVWLPEPVDRLKQKEVASVTSRDPWPFRGLLLTAIPLATLGISSLLTSVNRSIWLVTVLLTMVVGVFFLFREAVFHWRGVLSNLLLYVAAFTLVAEMVIVVRTILLGSVR